MSTFGIFKDQPIDLVFHFLQRVPYSDLCSLAQTSFSWFQTVRNHVKTTQFQKNALKSQSFFDIGQLIGVISELDNTDLIENFLQKVWKQEKQFGGIGKIIIGFCSSSKDKLMMMKRVTKTFNFIWKLVGSLDEDVMESTEDLGFGDDDIDMDFEDIEDEINKRTEKRIKLRRQLLSLFLADTESETYRFFLLELIRKIREVLNDDKECIVQVLHILFDPILFHDNEEFIDMFFFEQMNVEGEEDKEVLVSIAKIFNELQNNNMCQEENKFCAELFNGFMSHPSEWSDSNKASLLAQEPSLISWYLQDHSFLVVMGYKVAEILVETSMLMYKQGSQKLEELKEALLKVKQCTMKELNGRKHLNNLYRRIRRIANEYAEGIEQFGECPQLYEFFNCFDVLIN